MKSLLFAIGLMLTLSETHARCHDGYADHIIKDVFSVSTPGFIGLSKINAEAGKEVSRICASNCYLNRSDDCEMRYAAVVSKYQGHISQALGKTADQAKLNSYLSPPAPTPPSSPMPKYCGPGAADEIIKNIFSVQAVNLGDIAKPAADEIVKVCEDGCHPSMIANQLKRKNCHKAYATIIEKHKAEISEGLGKEADQKILESYYDTSIHFGWNATPSHQEIPGCNPIGDYKRYVVNPVQISKCGSISNAVLCEKSLDCQEGSQYGQNIGKFQDS